ncbi:serine/threonine-protein kinase [Nonomuraea diastatica]|uniref:serine/threonine-protein kinase n=1 Tax=Nonomuraea diastatica TaxID=1848329 RepID=UPI00140AB075|nr:serine/threonine-protein kinase [Nonomuraea diastatica]
MRPLTVGDPVIIGRYLLLGRLGAGGMGVVYLAEHPRGGLVALKTPHAVHLNDATLRTRFAEEVAFSRRLVPFCTAAVVEDGTDQGRPYLVTEYIPGPALSRVVLAEGPLTPDRAYGVALGVAAALVAVHEAGLVHRDLKPGNVLLSAKGPRVIDFGIARDVDTLSAHTQAGQVMGSPGWVAPERLTDQSTDRALPASDVFAWGCLVAFAATGHHPFGSGEADVLTRRILFEPPRIEGVPALLRPAVEAALAKEPADRPRAAELLRVLLAAGGVGDPWDLRQVVDEVLSEIWTAVPYPQGGGRVRHGGAGTGSGALAAASGEAGLERSRRRRRARAGASLSHASFAALATVSIAAITVIAASGADGAPIGGGSLLPGDPPPAVRPEGSAASTTHPVATLAGRVPPTRTVRATAPATPTVFVTRTRTKEGAGSPSPHRWDTFRPPRGRPSGAARPEEPRGDGPGACADPAGRRRGAMARRDCPRPSSSISTIPQDGPGESPGPSTPGRDTPTPTPTGSS